MPTSSVRVAKAVAKKVDLLPIVEQSIDKALNGVNNTALEPEHITEALQNAFRGEVREALRLAVKELVSATSSEEKSEPQARTG